MTILAPEPVEEVQGFTSSTELVLWAGKPPLVNGAGVCNWCTMRGCTSVDDCARRREESLWVVCPRCEGGVFDTTDSCCFGGLVEVDRRMYDLYAAGIPIEDARAHW